MSTKKTLDKKMYTVDELQAFASKMVETVAKATQPQAQAGRRAEVWNPGPVCRECGQYQAGCKGEHTMMVVLPSREEFIEWFPGVWINHVKYESAHPANPICVPTNAVGTIKEIIQNYERGERRLTKGHDHSRRSPIGRAGPSGAELTADLRPVYV